MVNVDKWELVEHADVMVDDKIKVIVVTKGSCPAETKETYKGKVAYLSGGDIYLDDGSAWEDINADTEEKVSIYRRKITPKPFKLPTEFGAVVSGVPSESHWQNPARERVWLVFDGADWTCTFTTYTSSRLQSHYADLRVERKGMKIDRA